MSAARRASLPGRSADAEEQTVNQLRTDASAAPDQRQAIA